MKRIYRYLPILIALMAVSSCTLFMDDEELPPDQVGFDDVATIETDAVKIEYQFQENVKNIAINVLEYVDHVEADSIVYFVGNTPKEYIPKVGECMSSVISRKIPFGLNHRVISVTKQDGMTKVVGAKTSLQDVYKKFDADIDFSKVDYPEIHATDSATFYDNGLDEMRFTDWTYYDKVVAQDSVRNAPLMKMPSRMSMTRGEDDWEEEYWLKDFINHKGDPHECTLTLLSFDTADYDDEDPKENVDKLGKILVDLFKKKILKNMEAKLGYPVYLKMEVQMPITFTGNMHIGLDPELSYHSLLTVEPELSITAQIRISKSDDTDDGDVINALNKVLGKVSRDKLKVKLPMPSAPIPLGPTGLFLEISPDISAGFEVGLAGTYENHRYLKGMDIEIGGENWGVRTRKPSKADYSKYDISGFFSASLNGSVKLGISVAKVANLNVVLGPEATLSIDKTFLESFEIPPLAEKEQYGSYTADKNKAGVDVDFVVSAGAEIVGLAGLSQEVFRGNIFGIATYLQPNLDDISLSNYVYDEEDYVTSFDATMVFDDNGWIPSYKNNVNVGVLVQDEDGKEDGFMRLYLCQDGYDKVDTKHEYVINCDNLPHGKEYVVMPVLVHDTFFTGERINDILSGNNIILPANAYAFSTKNVKNELIYNEKIKNLTERNMTVSHLKNVRKRYPKWETTYKSGEYYYLAWITSFDVMGGPNVEEFGVDISIGYNDEAQQATVMKKMEVPIQKKSNGAIASGTKTMLFDFVSEMPQDIWWSINYPSYMIDIRPYYKDKEGKKRHTVHSDRNIINVKHTMTNPKKYADFEKIGEPTSVVAK